MALKLNRPRMRIVLLALLPLLALAMWHYTFSHVPWLHVVGVSSDGDRVVYVEAKSTGNLWSNDTGQLTHHELVVRDGDREIRESVIMRNIDSIALSFDQELLAIGEPNGRVAIYDATSLRPLRRADLLSSPFVAESLAFSRNNKYLAISGGNSEANAWRFLIVDVATMTVTQELGPGEVFRKEDSLPYRLVHRTLYPGKTPPYYSVGQVVEFEQGRLQPIAEAPENIGTSYSASLRFAVDRSKSPQFLIWDRENETSRKLVIPDSFYPLFSPNSDQLVVSSVTELVSVVDPETASVVRSWHLDGERHGEAALSREGSWAAFATDAGEIEVWDYSSGVRKYKISDGAIRYRLRWALAVPTAILWCVAWLTIGWRDRYTTAAVRDIGVVSTVAGASFFLQLLYYIRPCNIRHPAAIGTVTVLIGASALLALWLVFGRMQWSRRLCAALTALAAIWGGPLWVSSRFGLADQPVAINGVLVIFLLVLLLLFLRWRRFAVVPSDAQAKPNAARQQPVQMSLRDLLIFPAVIGFLLLVGRMVYFPPDAHGWWVAMFAVLIPFQVLLIAMAVWAALSSRGTILRWAIGLGGILMLGIVVGYTLGDIALLWGPAIRWWVVSQATISLYVFFSLSMIRRCGWRWQRT